MSSSEKNIKRAYIDDFGGKSYKDSLSRLRTDNDIDYLRIQATNSSNMFEILQVFPNIQELDLLIHDFNQDMCNGMELPKLRTISFSKPVPEHLDNIWKLCTNLEEICIGSRSNSHLFTSEFVNRVIKANEKSLKTLRLLDIAVLSSSYRPLIVPCQLHELEITYCTEYSIESKCRSQEYEKQAFERRKNRNATARQFFTNEEELTTFQNLEDIIRSQINLESLILDDFKMDGQLLEIVASKTKLTYLKLMSIEYEFFEISEKIRQFFGKLKTVYLSHISNSTPSGFLLILESLKDLEVLEIHCIDPDFPFKPLVNKNLLPNLRKLKMHINHKSEDILDSFQFTEKLEYVSGDITHLEPVQTLLKSSPKIKKFILHYGEHEVANFIVTHFEKLEWFEVTTRTFSPETAILVIQNSGHIKRAKIHLYEYFKTEDEEFLDAELKEKFPGFYFHDKGGGGTMEIHNNEIDFKMRIGFHHFMLGGDW